MQTCSLRSFLRSAFLVTILGSSLLATPSHAQDHSPPLDIGVVKVLEGDAERLPPGLVETLGGGHVAEAQIDVATFETLIVSRDGFLEMTRHAGKREKLKRMLNRSTSLVAIDAAPHDLADALGIEVLELHLTTERYVAASVTLTGVDGSIAGGVLVPSEAPQALTSTELASDLQTHLTSISVLAQRNRKRGPGLQAYYLSPKMSSNTLDLCSSSLGGYGKYTEIATVSRVEDDGNASYDYWSIRMQQQTLGGYGHCGTDYRTNALATTVDMKRMDSTQRLYRYGPTTTNPDSTAAVNVGFSVGYAPADQEFSVGFSASREWSFTTPAVSVIDRSDFSTDIAAWTFNYNPGSDAAKWTYTSDPGFSLRTLQTRGMGFYKKSTLVWYHPIYTDPMRTIDWGYTFAR